MTLSLPHVLTVSLQKHIIQHSKSFLRESPPISPTQLIQPTLEQRSFRSLNYFFHLYTEATTEQEASFEETA